jgi:hypothetical protein
MPKTGGLQPGQKVKPYLQNNQSKRYGVMAQMVEHLPSKHKALSTKNKKLMKANKLPPTVECTNT